MDRIRCITRWSVDVFSPVRGEVVRGFEGNAEGSRELVLAYETMGIKKSTKSIIKRSLWRYAPQLFRALLRPREGAEFSIGIYSGEAPWSISPDERLQNPVLTWRDVSDVPASMVADPFMISVNGMYYMFFEIVNMLNRKGEIGFATSNDGCTWSYGERVLKEPYHLSYPYVFEWAGEYFMIPEGSRGGGIKLYRADDFPRAWNHVAELLSGNRYADSSIFRYDSKWYIFTDSGAEPLNPKLSLYCADRLTGPWEEHPASPIVTDDPHVARPGGRVLVVEGTVIRFAQDVYPIYGSKVRAFGITELSPTTYVEQEISSSPVLEAGGTEWRSGGMHHVDAHQTKEGGWLACVDGFYMRNSKKASS